MRPTLLVITLLLFFKYAYAQNKSLGTAKLPAGTEKRAAVIFANQDYDDPRYDLQKTHNDADDMAKVLGNIGFEVFPVKEDLNRTAFYREINALRDKLKGFQMVFFYYSGHGAEYQGQNYLIPTDIELEYDSDIKANGVEMALVYKVLAEARVKTTIVALDACRSLPIGKGGLPTGLSIPRDNPAGTFTMYATEAGKIARENNKGRNSYFTQELLKQLPVPNLDINQIHYNTRQAVKAATNEEQAPDVADKLDNKLVLLQKDTYDPEKEAMRAEIERLKAERETALKNATTPADNTRVTPSTATPAKTNDSSSFMSMISVQGGTFKRGDYDITVSDFSIGKYEVTVGQYMQFCKETNSHWPEWKEVDINYHIVTDKYDHYKKMGKALGNPKHPIVGVRWYDAVAFCDWLSKKKGKIYRLPTEAEWEYAAGGGNSGRTVWAGTDTESAIGKYGNVDGIADGYEYTSPVGIFMANRLGLHDLTGNVWEWCSDWYGDYPKQSETNPQGPATGTSRVLRGGSWNNAPAYACATNRHSHTPRYCNYYFGFRVVSPNPI